MSRKYSINFIIPYFGMFPNYFQLFLNSCKYNPEINWTIITDNKSDYIYPQNVRIVEETFENTVLKIRSKFDFDIKIGSVHKLCEYKPAYGYIFSDLIAEYDFWGYCDVDMIFGQIGKFLTDDILDNYSKIFTLGHMTLIRNNRKYNEMFMEQIDGHYLYKEAFTSDENYNFDEEFLGKPNINMLFDKHGEKVYRNNEYIADIYTKSSNFKLDTTNGVEKLKRVLFVWNKGIIQSYYKKDGKIVEKEYLYIHLQKRKMNLFVDAKKIDYYKIIPNAFEMVEYKSEDIINKYNYIRKKHANLQYYKIRYSNLRVKLKRKRRH